MAGKPLSIRSWNGGLGCRRDGLHRILARLVVQAACAASVFLLGDAIGHIREMAEADNFAPGNAGLPFYMDIICPVLAIALVTIAKRHDARR
jgi:hypothetical protein